MTVAKCTPADDAFIRPPVVEIALGRDEALVLIHELADALRAPPGLVHADVRTVDGKRLLVVIREGT